LKQTLHPLSCVVAQAIEIVGSECVAEKGKEFALGYHAIAVCVKLTKHFLHGFVSVSAHGLGEWRKLRERKHAVAVPVQVAKRLRQPCCVGLVMSIDGFTAPARMYEKTVLRGLVDLLHEDPDGLFCFPRPCQSKTHP
jgi:hypothetical protein